MGSYLVLSAQGFGAALVYTVTNWGTPGTNQFLEWPIYPLFAFVIFSVFMQINYLNKGKLLYINSNLALNLFSTAIVTPVYYVFFTGATIITSAILFRGFSKTNTVEAISILLGFFVIVCGVSLLFAYSLKEGVNEPGIKRNPNKNEEEIELHPLRSTHVDDFESESDDEHTPIPRANSQTPLTAPDRTQTVVEMKRVVASSNARMHIIPARSSEHIKNPNKVRHSPTPSMDFGVTFATRGIAMESNLGPGGSGSNNGRNEIEELKDIPRYDLLGSLSFRRRASPGA